MRTRMTNPDRKPERPRILYLAGPGDVLGTYRAWTTHGTDQSQLHVTFSEQVYGLARALDADLYVYGSNPRRQRLKEGRFIFRIEPVPLARRSGALYHLGMLWRALATLWIALRFRPHVALVGQDTHVAFLRPLALLRIKAIGTLVNTLWSQDRPPSRPQRLLLGLARRFFLRTCTTTLCMSERIAAQVRAICAPHEPDVRVFLPRYQPDWFAHIPRPDPGATPFRFLFLGRLEVSKGVLDLVHALATVRAGAGRAVALEFCGDGPIRAEAEALTRQLGLEDAVRFHGHCDRNRLLEVFGASHVVVVPTRTSFPEGFNMVVLESVLAGRPVVTSSVCPALEVVAPAAMEVRPDSVPEYAQAMLALATDPRLYARKCAEAGRVAESVFRAENAYGSVLRRAVFAALGRTDAAGA